jgi:hypothetical protein
MVQLSVGTGDLDSTQFVQVHHVQAIKSVLRLPVSKRYWSYHQRED